VKHSEVVELIRKEVDAFMEALKDVMESDIKPLVKYGNPEDVIGKDFEQWTVEELQRAATIYGPKLEKFLAKKYVDELTELESQEV